MTSSKNNCRNLRLKERDFEIFQKVEVEGLTQRDVAAEYKLTQPAVCKIVNKVRRWLAQPAPSGFPETARNRRVFEAARTHRLRMNYLYRRAVQAYDVTCASEICVKDKTVNKSPAKEGALATVTRTKEQIVTTARPDTRCLVHAGKLSEMLAKFEGFDERGRIDVSINGRIPEVEEVANDAAWRELGQLYHAWEARQAAKEKAAAESAKSPARSEGETAPPQSEPVAAEPLSNRLSRTEPVIADNRNPCCETRDNCVSTVRESGEEKLSKGLSDRLSNEGADSAGEPGELRPLTPALSPEYRGEGVGRGCAAAYSNNPAAVRQEPRKPALPEAPPIPTGYIRRGDRCYPVPGFRHLSKPGERPFLPDSYRLDEYLFAWLPVAAEW